MDSDPDYSVDDEEEFEDEDGDGVSRAPDKIEAGQDLPEDLRWSDTSDESSNSTDRDGSSVEEDGNGRVSRKRPADDVLSFRPFKRQNGTLNHEYLDLLNRDIDDAAYRVCLEDPIDFPPSQIGLTFWSKLEKQQFFEALARLGRHDLLGIASRLGSKSVAEVHHYINFLDEAHALRRRLDRRSLIEPAEYPAAIELSQPCCHAQEEAADAVSFRQELREQRREEGKWNEHWDITPRLALEMDRSHKDTGGNQPPFSRLFHLSRWLQLSQRAFMNSSIPGSNWNYIDNKPPSMWATTFDDFHSLAVSVTKRLVQTTLFMSLSRIKAKSELIPGTRAAIRRRDVEAAVLSLGMSLNAREHWVKSARRLRLDVYEAPPSRKDDSDEEPMSYDEVEAALASGKPRDQAQGAWPEPTAREMPPETDVSSDSDSDSSEEEKSEDVEDGEVQREMRELMWYSTAGIRDVEAARQALKLRIITERRQEDDAERRDGYANYQGESAMWDLLKKKSPVELPRKQDPGRPEQSNLDVESIYPMGRDWTKKLEYHGEWETLGGKKVPDST